MADLPTGLPKLQPGKSTATTARNKSDSLEEKASTKVGSKSIPSKKPTDEAEENEHQLKKSAEKSVKVNKLSKNKTNSKTVQSNNLSMDMPVAHHKKEDLFTKFELLQYPVLDSKISCDQLRQLSNLVKLKNCSTASYFSQSSAWEGMEPIYHEPRKPKTDPTSRHKPMPATFDEIWCPVLADVEDSDMIIPPTFTYLENGAVKQTLPTLVTNPIRKDALPGYY